METFIGKITSRKLWIAVIVIVVCLLQSETFRTKLSLAFSRRAKGGAA